LGKIILSHGCYLASLVIVTLIVCFRGLHGCGDGGIFLREWVQKLREVLRGWNQSMWEYRGYGINYCGKSAGVYSALGKTMKATLCHDNNPWSSGPDERPPAGMRSIIAENPHARQKTSEEVAYYRLSI